MVESKEEVVGKEETYRMEYQCHNCKTEFVAKVPRGERAYGKGGKCPYCGVDDRVDDKDYWTHKILGPPSRY